MSITWIASYPKSGNTWVRAFLSNYLTRSVEPVGINQLIGQSVHIDRFLFDETMAVPSDLLDDGELAELRQLFLAQLSQTVSDPGFVKTHDCGAASDTGNSTFGMLSGGNRAIYLVRDPLDVAVSFAHHRNEPVDDVIALMRSPDAVLRGGRLFFDETLGRWGDHVDNWTDQRRSNVCVIRYEDLIDAPAESFTRLLDFCGLESDEKRVAQAVDFARFEALQKSEKQSGFDEKQSTASSFFRRGQKGSWRSALTRTQIETVIGDHEATMARFGYI